jgi:hypothetical protein
METVLRPASMQKVLNSEQLKAFYHNEFVSDQIAHFKDLVGRGKLGPKAPSEVIVDLGGGVGYFAEGLHHELGYRVRVVDLDPVSIDKCRARGLDACLGDAVGYEKKADEHIACLNLILHHLIGRDSEGTRAMQVKALQNWRRKDCLVFVNEYIYESLIPGFSGWLIYQVTTSKVLSAIGRLISKVIPSFRANTFGVGVRFRSDAEWTEVFKNAGLKVLAKREGVMERISPPLRILLIKSIRRSSYLLAPIE